MTTGSNLIRLGRKGLVLIWLTGVVALHLEITSSMSGWALNTDFYKFWISGKSLQDGSSAYFKLAELAQVRGVCRHGKEWLDIDKLPQANGYVEVPLGYERCIHPNLNPPFFVVLISPLASLSFERAWWVWSGLSLVCGMVATWLLAKPLSSALGSDKPWSTLLLLAAVLSWFPAIISSELGQVSMFLLFFLALAVASFRQRWPVGAGIILGVCAGLKPFFLLFILTLLLGKFYRVFCGLLLGLAFTIAIGWLVVGGQGYLEYLSLSQYVNWGDYSWNASLPGMIDRLWTYFFGGYLNKPVALLLNQLIANLILLSIAVWFLARFIGSIQRPARRFEVTISFTVIVALLLSPLGWSYYFLLLLIPGLLMIRQLATISDRRLYIIGLITFFLISALPLPFFRLPQESLVFSDVLYASVNFTNLVLFCGLFMSITIRAGQFAESSFSYTTTNLGVYAK